MRIGLNHLGLNSIAKAFSPQNLFMNGEPGAHFETYDPQSLLQRRNRLTYSSQFSNAAWARTNILSVTENADGVGDLVVPNTTSGAHLLSQSAATVGAPNTVTVRAKAGGYSWLLIALQNGSFSAYFDLTNGVTGNISAGASAFISAADGAPGYYDCIFSHPSPSNAICNIYAANSNGGVTFAGDGASGVYFARAQLEWNTATPSAYQDVTDWNTEYMAAALERIGMWQDANGTTPVTGVEQPVGMWRDIRMGKSLGPEQITNGNFANGATSWTTNVGAGDAVTISGGAVRIQTAGTNTTNIAQAAGMVANKTYQITFDVLPGSSGQLKVLPAGQSSEIVFTATAGKKVFNGIVPSSSSFVISRVVGQAADATITNISVKEVTGNHALQSTANSRPILKALYNLLTKTEQLDDSAWPKTNLAANAGSVASMRKLVPSNTVGAQHYLGQNITPTAGTYTIRVRAKAAGYSWLRIGFPGGPSVNVNTTTGAVGNNSGGANASPGVLQADGSYVFVVSGACSGSASSVFFSVNQTNTASAATEAFTADGVSGIEVGETDFRTADDAAKNIPAYQRVNTSTDYDTTGFPHYLKFDGSDDGLATGNIDFSGVDKMTVWAGATKLSDAGAAVLVELTANASTNAGSFFLASPGNPGTATHNWKSRGSVDPGTAITGATYAAPVSNVVTGIGDIAGDQAAARVNGVVAATLSADQGTGTYSNAPLYIARRGGSTLPFNGRIYSLTARGTTTPTTKPAYVNMEQYAARLAKLIFSST